METGRYFPALTGLRAVAAFMVFLHHSDLMQRAFGPNIIPWVKELHVGVTVFFVLSGFLIALRYEDRCRLERAWLSDYLANRFFRIYPLYFLLTLAVLSYSFWEDWTVRHKFFIPWETFLWNVTFLRGFFDKLKFSGIPQGWSLTVEECFYLSAPFLFYLARKTRWVRVLAPVALLAVGAGLVKLLSPLDYKGLFASMRFMLLYTYFGRATEFCLGWTLARRLVDHPGISKIPWKTALGVGGFLLSLLILVKLGPGHEYGLFHPWGIVTNNLIMPIFLCFLLAGLACERTPLARLLSTSAFDVLGKASYAFYLVHYGGIRKWAHHYVSQDDLIQLLFLTALSVLLYYGVEHPLNQGLRRLFKRWKAQRDRVHTPEPNPA